MQEIVTESMTERGISRVAVEAGCGTLPAQPSSFHRHVTFSLEIASRLIEE